MLLVLCLSVTVLASFKGFPTIDETEQKLSVFPEFIVGRSFEGRPIRMYLVTDAPHSRQVVEDADGKFEVPSVGVPCLLLTAMHHAREPLSLTTATQLLFQNFVSDKALRKSRCVAFIPFVNPDGYAFICQTGFLMARKNRRPTCEAATHSGVDLNRNYGFHWAHQYPKCSLDEYEGSGAFSEPESRAIRRVARNMKTVVSALNFHSFGKGEWAIPYNCCADLSIPRWARVVVDDLKSVEGMNPLHSAPSNPALGYTTSGEADDYLLNEFNILSASPEVGKEFWPADATRAIQAATEENQVGFREWLRITGPRLRVKWVGDSTVELTNTGLVPIRPSVSLWMKADSVQFNMNATRLAGLESRLGSEAGALRTGDIFALVPERAVDRVCVHDDKTTCHYRSGEVVETHLAMDLPQLFVNTGIGLLVVVLGVASATLVEQRAFFSAVWAVKTNTVGSSL